MSEKTKGQISQNDDCNIYKKMKHATCSEKLTFLTPLYAKINRPNIIKWGLEKIVKKTFGSSIALQLSFWDFPSCLLADKTIVIKSSFFSGRFPRSVSADCFYGGKMDKMWSLFTMNKISGTMSITCLWCLNWWLWTDFTSCLSVSTRG